MTWVKLDDQFPDHPKVVKAGGDAAWLHVTAICYANRHLTDGFIPEGQVIRLSDRRNPAKLAAELVKVGMWETAVGGWMIHDFLDWNPSAAEVKKRREKERDRKAQQRRGDDGRYSKGDTQEESQQDTQQDSNGSHARSHTVPSFSRPTDVPHHPPTHAGGGNGDEDEIWPMLAERKLTEVLAGGGSVGNTEAWKRKTAAAAKADLAQRRAELEGSFVLTKTELVDALMGRTNVLRTAQRR